MDGDLNPMEDKILEAIKAKTLTEGGIKKGLLALIDAEIDQQERPANMELVNACQNLLFQLSNQAYVINKDDSLAKAKVKLASHFKRKFVLRRTIRIAAVLVILIGGGFGLDVLLRNEFLTVQPTADEQQIEIRGNVTHDVFITDGKADAGKHEANIIGSDALEDAAAVLGYYPEVPTWMPEGWIPLNYFASTSQYVSVFRTKYVQDPEENLIIYSVTKYEDVEKALAAFEQSKNGEVHQWNGITVYVSVNIDEPVALWLSDTTCYSLSGPLSNEELEQIIKSIKRSETNNETQ